MGTVIKTFYIHYERYISAGALLVGFIVDNFTLKRIDFLFENLVLVSYLAIAGGGIALLVYHKQVAPTHKYFEIFVLFVPIFIQFAFGGLFSAFFIFYSRSGSLTGSIFFLILILGLLIGNEFFRNQYKKIVFQLSIFYIALFSFAIFFIPVLLGVMGAYIFVVSGIVSLIVISLFIYGLSHINHEQIIHERSNLIQAVGGIFIFINIFYFTNIIPPAPLSLKDVGVYHAVEKQDDGSYLVHKEFQKNSIFEIGKTIIHHAPNERVYVFSSVFAPTKLSTTIAHRWQYFNTKSGKWVIANNISFPLTGGRGDGYRGFTFKESIFPGKWRVDVVTSRGQIIGRVNFTIQVVDTPVVLYVDEK